MFTSKKIIYELISTSINDIERTLISSANERNIPWMARSGIVNKAEGMLGFVSCFPHGLPTENSVDGILLISENTFSFNIQVTVSWSNGLFVADVGEVTLSINDDDSKLTDWNDIVSSLIVIMHQTLLESQKGLNMFGGK